MKVKSEHKNKAYFLYYPLYPPSLNEREKGWEGGLPHVTETGMLVILLRGVDLRCLVSLRVFQTNTYILNRWVSFWVACEDFEKK